MLVDFVAYPKVKIHRSMDEGKEKKVNNIISMIQHVSYKLIYLETTPVLPLNLYLV